MYKAINSASIHDAGTKPPRRRLIPGPEARVEKLPWRPTVKFVNRAGHVVRVAITGGSALNHDPSAERRVREMHRRRGSIPYGECPLRSQAMSDADFPEELRGVLCDMRNEFGEERACPHVEHVITVRKARQKQSFEERQRAQLSAERARAEKDNQLIDALRGAVEAMATTTATAQPKRRGRKPSEDRTDSTE